MSETTIGRLAIRLPGDDPELAYRLAQLVAARLVSPLAPGPADGSVALLRLDVPETSGEDVEALAARIASHVVGGLTEAGR